VVREAAHREDGEERQHRAGIEPRAGLRRALEIERLAVVGVGPEDQHRDRAERREHQAEGDDEVGVVNRVAPDQQAARAQEQGEDPGQGKSSRQRGIRRQPAVAIRTLKCHTTRIGAPARALERWFAASC
jgi:hypothetical protein